MEQFQVCNILNPNSADNIKQMARSLFLLGRHKLGRKLEKLYIDILPCIYIVAIEAYKQAENRSETADWEVSHNLGMCHMYLKEWDQARQCLETALSLSSHQQTYLVLARVFLMSGDVAGAVRYIKS